MNPDKWLELNYDYIKRMCLYYTTDLSLITHLYIWLVKHPNRWISMNSLSHNDQMKFTNTWLKNNSKWTNSDFNKENRVNDFNEIWDCQYESDTVVSIEIRSEDIDDNIKDWLIDIRMEFGEDAEKLIKIRSIYLKMSTIDKVLYDLYFTKEMTLRSISKHLSIPLSSTHQMVMNLKNKIKEKCGIKFI